MAAKSAGHSRLLLYIIHTAFEVADSNGSRKSVAFYLRRSSAGNSVKIPITQARKIYNILTPPTGRLPPLV